MVIKSSQIENYGFINDKIILAPMVRGSELAFRTLMRRHGVRQCYSPMLRAAEVVNAYRVWNAHGGEEVDLSEVRHEDGMLLLTDIIKDKEPLTVQLCGGSPEILAAATKIILRLQLSESLQIRGIDLNLGCPQPCACDGNFGAFLAEREPDLAVKCVKAMRQAIDSFCNDLNDSNTNPPRLSCKIRLRDSHDETLSFAKKLEDAGCDLLAIHCRHRVEKHNGLPDIVSGEKLIRSLSIPVIINGCIVNNSNDASESLKMTGAHGLMIARAFLENPRLLHEPDADPAFLAAEYLDCAELFPPPSPLYIRKHLRWIFRKHLEPQKDKKKRHDYSDFRYRLWTFLVRPYLDNIEQFRQVVCLYVKLNGSSMPESLKHQPEPSFRSIRHKLDESDDISTSNDGESEEFKAEMLINLFQ